MDEAQDAGVRREREDPVSPDRPFVIISGGHGPLSSIRSERCCDRWGHHRGWGFHDL